RSTPSSPRSAISRPIRSICAPSPKCARRRRRWSTRSASTPAGRARRPPPRPSLPMLVSTIRRAAPKGEARIWVFASVAIALLVLAPVAALVAIAAQGSGDLWPHLARYVLPQSVRDTALLLAGGRVILVTIGVGTSWLVSACRFPGRGLFDWALLLPLAVPTYIVAFAYLDVLHPLGPIQTAVRTVFGIEDVRGFSLPEIRSLWGACVLLRLVLYPYVYLSARALFLM